MLPRQLLAAVWMLLLALSASAGELPLLLAERYTPGIEVSRYWVSEKLDPDFPR